MPCNADTIANDKGAIANHGNCIDNPMPATCADGSKEEARSACRAG